MATETVIFKIEGELLREVDKTFKRSGFQNRTEFIRSALREKVEEAKLKEAMMQIAHLRGASKKKTSDEEIERTRERVFREFEKKFK
jgi:metal-responsive CopG/Arc/MetJ family transcriptional regulator